MVLRMTYKIIIALILITSQNTAFADEFIQGISFKCSKNAFLIETHNLENEYPNAKDLPKGNNIYFNEGKYKESCIVGGNEILVNFENLKISEKGVCGLAPGSKITIRVNDKILIKSISFNNSCYESLRRVEFLQDQFVGFTFKYCGSTGGGSLVVDGCFTFTQGLFEKIKKPLHRGFISKPYWDAYIDLYNKS